MKTDAAELKAVLSEDKKLSHLPLRYCFQIAAFISLLRFDIFHLECDAQRYIYSPD